MFRSCVIMAISKNFKESSEKFLKNFEYNYTDNLEINCLDVVSYLLPNFIFVDPIYRSLFSSSCYPFILHTTSVDERCKRAHVPFKQHNMGLKLIGSFSSTESFASKNIKRKIRLYAGSTLVCLPTHVPYGLSFWAPEHRKCCGCECRSHPSKVKQFCSAVCNSNWITFEAKHDGKI